MKIMGFNFDKISAEKLSDKVENLKINTNINISDIKPIKSLFLGVEEKFIGVKFKYEIEYSPKFAKLEFIGVIIISVGEKASEEILDQWKNKETPEEFRIKLFNIILRKSNLKALQLEDEMNIPLHIPLPSIQKQEKDKKEKK